MSILIKRVNARKTYSVRLHTDNTNSAVRFVTQGIELSSVAAFFQKKVVPTATNASIAIMLKTSMPLKTIATNEARPVEIVPVDSSCRHIFSLSLNVNTLPFVQPFLSI